MRLCKYLAHCGAASRRGADALIFAGRVQVNGETILEPGRDVAPGDSVLLDGKALELEGEKVTYAFHKPAGVICSSADPQGRERVADYFKDLPYRLYTVGRLDYDSEGLILVTNDGDLANMLTHPRHGVEKEYFAVCEGRVSEADRKKLMSGVRLEDGPSAPALVTVLNAHERSTELSIILREGRNRQVRRMMEAVGHPVKKLRRERIGALSLEGLARGQRRLLSQDEIDEFLVGADAHSGP